MARRAPEIPLRLFISLLAAIMVVGKIGEATAPMLLSRNSPILLLLLNANDINLVLTTAQCETRVATWAAVATLRRTAEDAAYYFFARAHGARATAFARLLLAGQAALDVAVVSEDAAGWPMARSAATGR